MPATVFNISDINAFYQFMDSICLKSQTGAKLTLDTFNQFVATANWKKFKQKSGIPEEYQVGQPYPRQAYEVSQSIIDSLSRFKVAMGTDGVPPLTISTDGIATLPTDYVHYSSLGYNFYTNVPNCNFNKSTKMIEPLTDAEWNDRIDHPIKPPSYKYPICRFLNGKIEFAPKDLRFVNFVYLRKPNTPFLSYTLNPDTSYNYIHASSVQLEWAENDIIDIASIIFELSGAGNRDQFLLQYGDKMKKEEM